MGKVVITIEYEDAKHPAGQPPRVGHPPKPNFPLPNFQQGQHVNVDPKVVGELMKQFLPMMVGKQVIEQQKEEGEKEDGKH